MGGTNTHEVGVLAEIWVRFSVYFANTHPPILTASSLPKETMALIQKSKAEMQPVSTHLPSAQNHTQ